MSNVQTTVLMSPARVRRTIERMAFQIAERFGGRPLLLVGLHAKGGALAQALATVLDRRIGASASTVGLDASTLTAHGSPDGRPGPEGSHPEAWRRIKAHAGHVILVDDVIFTGRTLHKVVRWLPESQEMESLSICVLIDRGHREFPVHPAITGLTLPTKPGEHIEVRMPHRSLKPSPSPAGGPLATAAGSKDASDGPLATASGGPSTDESAAFIGEVVLTSSPN